MIILQPVAVRHPAVPVDLSPVLTAIQNLQDLMVAKFDAVFAAIDNISPSTGTDHWDEYWAAYNPNTDSAYYWQYWNSDTGKYENTNLANVLNMLSWYEGNIYLKILNLEKVANNTFNKLVEVADDVASIAKGIVGKQDTALTDKANDLNQKVNDLDKNQGQIEDSISGSIESFTPDSSVFGGLKAIKWCSSYLQSCYESLGSYGIPIMVALILGVCLQFIGYFRYKGGGG